MFSIDCAAHRRTYEAALRGAGFRLTRPRRAILEVLSATDEALRPEDIQQRAVVRCPGIRLATVYRTPNLLADITCIRRLHQEGHCQGFALASLSHSHHLVCRNCDQVVEFPGSEDIGGVIGQLASQTGFQIEDHLLELVGICPACQASDPGGPG